MVRSWKDNIRFFFFLKETFSLRIYDHNKIDCGIYYIFYLQLLGEVVGDYGGEGGEQGSQEHADITDVNGDVEKV